jgi:hypothetical protein
MVIPHLFFLLIKLQVRNSLVFVLLKTLLALVPALYSTGSAEHGRIVLYGQCTSGQYSNWNCGAIDFTNLRSPLIDNRIAIIRARGYDNNAETSGMMDFFTWDEEDKHMNISLHLDAKGRVSLGAGNGYPFSTHATAWTMLSPGNSNQFGAPLKFRAGPCLTIPENGALEYDGSKLYFTIGEDRVQLAPVRRFGVEWGVSILLGVIALWRTRNKKV